MKKMQKIFLVLALVLFTGISDAVAQIYIGIRPSRPVYVRAERPSPRHVWVDEEWVERDGRYEWGGGYWAEPPQPGFIWVQGRWRSSPRGSYWMHGHWDRGRHVGRDHDDRGHGHGYGHRDRE